MTQTEVSGTESGGRDRISTRGGSTNPNMGGSTIPHMLAQFR